MPQSSFSMPFDTSPGHSEKKALPTRRKYVLRVFRDQDGVRMHWGLSGLGDASHTCLCRGYSLALVKIVVIE